MELYGQIITKIYHVKDGTGRDKEGKTWAYRIWNIYFEDNDKKFTYFTSGKKPEPFEGMKIGYLKYTEKQETSKKDGKVYTNYTIDELKVSEDSPQPQAGQRVQAKTQSTDWDAIARGKCKFGFLQQAFVPYLKGELFKDEEGKLPLLEEAAELFADLCMRWFPGATTAPQTAKEEKDVPERASGGPDRDIPPIEAYEEE